MDYKNKLFISLSATQDARNNAATSNEPNELGDLMANPEYLRHSSSIINDALKEGFDVLQLPNGDIVTTGTKIITNTYVWDATSGSMGKARTPAAKAPRARKAKSSPAASAE